ncbi:hypothetical protein D0Y65_048504 [Glycine soja]|uniref:Uncharacterized protein n=1 Tax=Glycine soja TaxID=3848 RepID=A0A445FT93_GLYSO|nr:hypothetical protein D0Y65_048504 [Glycine soja]
MKYESFYFLSWEMEIGVEGVNWSLILKFKEVYVRRQMRLVTKSNFKWIDKFTKSISSERLEA